MENPHELWPVDGLIKTGRNSYNGYFTKVLGDDKTIDGWAFDRQLNSRSTNVLDVFGSGLIEENPSIFDSVTGVRLKPIDPNAVPRNYRTHKNWKEVIGNAHSRAVWRNLDRSLKDRGIASIDLITIRPVYPLEGPAKKIFPHGSDLKKRTFLSDCSKILTNAWQRLGTDEGIMLVQLTPEIISDALFTKWVADLSNNRIAYVLSRDPKAPSIKLIKNSALQLLPEIK